MFLKVAPVVCYGSRTAIAKASICTQAIFQHFEILYLTHSICQQNNPDFSAFLDSIGDDAEHLDVDLGHLQHTHSLEHCINFVFSPGDSHESNGVCKTCNFESLQ